MSRYAYDFCPSESDSAILLDQIENMVRNAVETALKPASKEERKPKGKQPPKAKVSPRLFLSQEHMTKRGTIICSHLLAMPKGEVPSDNLDLKHVFNQHPFDDEKVRDGWNAISDRGLNTMFPEYDIYWLCSADWLSEAVVEAVVSTAIKVEKTAPSKTPIRKVTNEIILG